MNTYLTKFRISNIGRVIDQQEIVSWLQAFHLPENRDVVEKYSIKKEMISTRLTLASGICEDSDESSLYSLEHPQPNLTKRAAHAQKALQPVVEELYQDSKPPEMINHVSCTHYQSPSVIQNLICENEWQTQTESLHLYHMGCYAALPATKTARAYVISGKKQVDNVHTEICSFHLNQEEGTADKVIMQTLFADGAIKYSCVSESEFSQTSEKGLQILGMHEELIPNTSELMTWQLDKNSFVMTLSKKVPMLLAKKITSFIETLFAEAGFNYQEERNKALFAIHPGGPKIIELTQKVLELEDWQVSSSIKILKARGNMSSATLPFIWNDIIENNEVDNQLVATVAFGPGLTITGALFRLCK